MESSLPLIAGAGPVGLAAALFLAKKGLKTRIIDAAEEPSRWSKALAINPRTLEILARVGLAERVLSLGKRIGGACVWRGEHVRAQIDFKGLGHEYPFMTALSQAATERLLTESLAEMGHRVERGVRLVECQNSSGGVQAVLVSRDGQRETVTCPWLLAADGAHSTVRERVAMPFPGSAFRNEWHLADIELRTTLPEDRAHIHFLNGGEFLFLIRVIDPELDSLGPVWRVIGNRPQPLDRCAVGSITGPPIWSSTFRISHRIVRSLSAGQIHFAGDAAHLHSPIGARGMNLGIEDAWVFAGLAARNQLARYNELRRPIDRNVVGRVNMLSRVVACEPRFLAAVRSWLPTLMGLPITQRRMLSVMAGINHPLE